MIFQFIGTGASDYDWSHYGNKDVLGASAGLLDGHILIDCGPTVPAALRRFGTDISHITAIVFTHSHSDHFDMTCLREIAGQRRLRIYGPGAICSQVAEFCEVHPLQVGEHFSIDGRYSFHALPANHSVPDLFEPTFLYAIQSEKKVLLYAVDTAGLSSQAFFLLGKIQFDVLVWDATTSAPRGDRTIFQHSNPELFSLIRRSLLNSGIVRPDTRCYLSHRSFQFWPSAPAELTDIEQKYGVILARDGETVEI